MDSIEKMAITAQMVELRTMQLELNDVIERRIEALEAKLKMLRGFSQMEKDDE